MLASTAAALVLVLAATASSGWANAHTGIATEYGLGSGRLTFRIGVPCRLYLENRGKERREFAARSFLMSVRFDTPDVLSADRR